ncbi:peptidoglycan editing factor PgeF [Salicibibacter cibarius]|uniref:Purine nucleoside phosphorylase n=1 Tax=Salicibibacter cibarius TaxID=2743000 RepID=A0A7T7CC80_9BACI|nr:peptidoglycan editing factor PgeF [Salicibibacter cibarius]QQK76724.1 peptidoglycan editing factor PgeF [Salicibibacter cibarius]
MNREPFALHPTKTLLEIRGPKQVRAGFTTRLGGISRDPYNEANYGFHVGDDSDHVMANREQLANALDISLSRAVFGEQVHGGVVRKVDETDGGRGSFKLDDTIPDVDGLYTTTKNLWLMSLYADCVPLYFYNRGQTIAGIAHAGWKGTAANIGGEMVRIWDEIEGIPAEAIHVVIGPSIGKAAYEVDDKVITALKKVLPRGKEPWTQHESGLFQLDLKEANALLLEKAGIKRAHMDISNACTYENEELFFSHRRDSGQTGRMMAYIGFLNTAGSDEE